MTEKAEQQVSFSAGQQAPTDDYRVVHPNGEVEPDGPVQSLGDGGASVVYRTRFKGLMDRAIKILEPRHGVPDADRLKKMRKTFQLEVSLLSRLTHSHLAKITDVGFDEDYWWYAMDYVDGDELTPEYWERCPMEAPMFLRLVNQILDAVEYMHAQGVMHSDLKGKNMLVSRDGNFQVTVLDLGVAKVLKGPLVDKLREEEEFLETEDRASGQAAALNDGQPQGAGKIASQETWELEDLTLFFSSESITRGIWKGYLDKPISRKTLAEFFPTHDLYAIGVLLRGALSVAAQRTKLERGLGPAGIGAMERVRDRLLIVDEDDKYDSAAELRRDWAKLDPGYLAPLRIRELAVGATAATSIATPTGRVSLSDRMLAVLNHPAMQRLRNIPQLEFVSLVFPGATHTRLLHSLTTFDTTRRYLLHLLKDPEFRLMVDDHDVEATLLWGLTHDIGHYPLSHMFEDFATEQAATGEKRTIPTDDDLLWAFLEPDRIHPDFAAYAQFIRTDLGATSSARGRSFDEMLRHDDLFAPEVFDRLLAIADSEEPRYRMLRGILSSSIDADKVSYLTDDSAMTGVRYGRGLDVDGLLASLRAPEKHDVSPGTDGILAITDKGLGGAESVILARAWMLKRVYWHHTNRGVIGMVKSVIAQLRDAGRLDMGEYLRDNLLADAPQALKWLSDRFDAAVVEGKLGDPSPRNPLAGILGGERQIYKRLLTVAKGRDERLYGRLSFKRSAELRDVVEIVERVLREHLDDPGAMRPGDVIIDVPSMPRELSRTPVLMYPQDSTQPVQDLHSASPVVAALREEFEAHVKKCRIMCHPALALQLQGRRDQARLAVRRALEDS